METINFVKYQATGNDFILIDAREIHFRWKQLAQKMCDRHFGIGADGIILVLKTNSADLKMRIFNSDGSEAEICGNGLRCFAKFAMDYGFITGNTFSVATKAGIKHVKVYRRNGKVSSATINLGKPVFNATMIPVSITDRNKYQNKQNSMISDYPINIKGNTLKLSFVSMGNPHAINFISETVDKFPLTEIGPLVENNSIFPSRTNFEIARIVDISKIEARVWERGVGETLACGSGAAAIAVAAINSGRTNNNVDIILHGGTLNIQLNNNSEVYLTGPVKEVFRGEYSN